MCKFQALQNMDPPGGSLKCVLFNFLDLAGDSVTAGITIREWRGFYSSVTCSSFESGVRAPLFIPCFRYGRPKESQPVANVLSALLFHLHRHSPGLASLVSELRRLHPVASRL